MSDDCPTCRAVEALLVGSRRVPKPVARKIARSKVTRSADKALRKTKTVRKVSQYQKKLSKHLRKEREKATKKNGDFKKGRSMKTVMAAAHKCVKRELKE
tara:strand:- start:65 stop:364 length:300 start_codon:yes stop_codon:yes gene_type:complete